MEADLTSQANNGLFKSMFKTGSSSGRDLNGFLLEKVKTDSITKEIHHLGVMNFVLNRYTHERHLLEINIEMLSAGDRTLTHGFLHRVGSRGTRFGRRPTTFR